MISSSFDF